MGLEHPGALELAARMRQDQLLNEAAHRRRLQEATRGHPVQRISPTTALAALVGFLVGWSVASGPALLWRLAS